MAIAAGRGNWANAAARSKARKSNLLDETRLRQLLKSGPDTIAASIGEGSYRKEMDIYSRDLAADLVEAALATILREKFLKSARYCKVVSEV